MGPLGSQVSAEVETPGQPPSRTERLQPFHRRMGSLLGGALLNLAALGGLVFVVLIILSVAFNITLIMFKTGSMSPTIPAGSLAVVKQIPAVDIRIGDVLTVDRGESLPVTHRVTSVKGTGAERIITMKGDANQAEDPLPYTVTEARRVLVSVPGLARVVVWFANPLVLGSLTIATSVLVTWAFWPRSERRRRRTQGRDDDGSRGQATADASTTTNSSRSGAAVGLLAIALGAGLALLLPAASPAEATPPLMTHPGPTPSSQEETVTRGEHLTLTSIGDPSEMLSMQPGVPVNWQVGISVAPTDPGGVGIAVAAQGSPELGLLLEYQTCSVQWVGVHCSGEMRSLGALSPVSVEGEYAPLFEMHADNLEEWILVSATIPAPAKGSVELIVRASGESETVTAGPGSVGTLSRTGADPGWAALLGLGAVTAGLAAAGLASTRQKTKQQRGTS